VFLGALAVAAFLAGAAGAWILQPPKDHPKEINITRAAPRGDRLDIASNYVRKVVDDLPEMPVLPRPVPKVAQQDVEEEKDEALPADAKSPPPKPQAKANDICAKNHGRREEYSKHGRLMWRCAYD
jgi:hypothetical protein